MAEDKAMPDTGDGTVRLADQRVTVRVLARVIASLAAIAVSGWWFMFDEVRLVRGDVADQGATLAREIDGSARFQIEQRDRLWNRVDGLRQEIREVQIELGDMRARLDQIGRTADAIFAVVRPDPGGAARGPGDPKRSSVSRTDRSSWTGTVATPTR